MHKNTSTMAQTQQRHKKNVISVVRTHFVDSISLRNSSIVSVQSLVRGYHFAFALWCGDPEPCCGNVLIVSSNDSRVILVAMSDRQTREVDGPECHWQDKFRLEEIFAEVCAEFWKLWQDCGPLYYIPAGTWSVPFELATVPVKNYWRSQNKNNYHRPSEGLGNHPGNVLLCSNRR